MLARCMLSSCVCQSFTSRYCMKTALQNELILAWQLPSTYPTLCYKEIRVSPEIRHFPIEICPKLRTLEISPRPADRVVNKTRRRRRRRQWSLLTTPGTVDESWLFNYICRSTVNGSLCYFDLLWICCSTCFYN